MQRHRRARADLAGVLQGIPRHEPHRYLRLQRLARVRAALRHADPATANVSDIARRHGFLQLGRFATQYRAVFGEVPSTTLQGAAKDADDTAESA